jgi:hypothetical protein
MTKFAKYISLVLILTLSGCAINSSKSTIIPNANLNKIETIYVERFAPDQRGINTIIVNRLSSMGYKATTGGVIPENVDAIVTYKDKWWWDIRMYMLELTIKVKEPKTDYPMASGNSYHTSLSRLSPEEMVSEVLNNIFNKEK